MGSTDTFRTVLYLTSLDTMCSVSECEVRFEVRVGGRGPRDILVNDRLLLMHCYWLTN